VPGSAGGEHFEQLHRASFDKKQPGYLHLCVEPEGRLRYLRFVLSKLRRSDVTDFMFVGETQVVPVTE